MIGKAAGVAGADLVWIGIDVGKVSHHAVAIDADGVPLWSLKVANDQKALEELLHRAVQSDAEVRWALDLMSAAGAWLTAVLVTGRQKVLYVPGRAVHKMAGVFRGEGQTDAKDARINADTARMRHRDLAEVAAPDDLDVELGRLTTHRTDLMADWVRGVNRLRELLTGIFPALERSFDVSTRSALILALTPLHMPHGSSAAHQNAPHRSPHQPVEEPDSSLSSLTRTPAAILPSMSCLR